MSASAVQQMSTSEYLNWIRYFEAKASAMERQEEISKGNLMAMDEDDIVAEVTGGG